MFTANVKNLSVMCVVYSPLLVTTLTHSKSLSENSLGFSLTQSSHLLMTFPSYLLILYVLSLFLSYLTG